MGDLRKTQTPINSVLQSLRLLLPTARYLDHYLFEYRAIVWLNTECTMLLLQHGARILYYRAFLAESPQSLGSIWSNRNTARNSLNFSVLRTPTLTVCARN